MVRLWIIVFPVSIYCYIYVYIFIFVFSVSEFLCKLCSSLSVNWSLTNKYGKRTKFYLNLKITAGGDCSHEIKRHLLLGRRVMTNLDSILKSRDITLPTKVRLVKAVVFPVVMYGCGVGLWRRLSTEELMLLNCGVGEDSWESLGLQGDPTSPF